MRIFPHTPFPIPKCIIYAFLLSTSIFADTLYLKDGQEIKDAVVTEINDNEVKYKISDRQVVYTTKKSNVFMILYENGTKDVFGSETEKPVANVANVYKAEGNEAEKESVANEKKNRYGIRAAVNFSQSTSEYSYVEFIGGGAGLGISGGFSVGFITMMSIINTIQFKSELNILYRELPFYIYYNNRDYEFSLIDISISIPTLVYQTPFGSSFYLEAGFQTDINIISDYIGGGVGDIDRSTLDFSLVFGSGWNFNNNWGLGLRSIIGLNDFSSDLGGSIIQIDFGLSYLF